jgi:radical SAM family RiPP maturation amino acid epimerase
MEQYPILQMWSRYRMHRSQLYVKQREFLTTTYSASKQYSAWRMRRIAATKSELGFYGHDIDHPSVAIEMQVGCTVGCYFCAFDAPKLQKVFDYNDEANRELFRGVAKSLLKHLGWSSGHALLYWSTEPADNPNYVDWMKEYRAVTGASVCTATARADEQWVSKLINHYRPMRQPWPRISVLTRSIMYKIMKRFTPEEAQDMVLLMQQKDGEEQRAKVPGGRDKMIARLAEYKDLRELDVDEKPEDLFVPQGSIACVSGFLINIIEKTIRLISPCYTTEQYRYGYRVFDEVSFTDAADFERKLANVIERKCVLEPYGEMRMRFRDDLRYRPRPDGFKLTSKNVVHHLTGDELYAPLGEMISAGTHTYDAIIENLIERGFNPMVATAAIKAMFDKGFLCELEISAPGAKPIAGQMLQMAN